MFREELDVCCHLGELFLTVLEASLLQEDSGQLKVALRFQSLDLELLIRSVWNQVVKHKIRLAIEVARLLESVIFLYAFFLQRDCRLLHHFLDLADFVRVALSIKINLFRMVLGAAHHLCEVLSLLSLKVSVLRLFYLLI